MLVTAVQSAEESHSVRLEPAATCQRSPRQRKEPQRLKWRHAVNWRSSVAAVIPPCVRDRGRRAGPFVRLARSERSRGRKAPWPVGAFRPIKRHRHPAAVRQHVVRTRATTAISSSRSRRGSGRPAIRLPRQVPELAASETNLNTAKAMRNGGLDSRSRPNGGRDPFRRASLLIPCIAAHNDRRSA
jgi:hypothetical protein